MGAKSTYILLACAIFGIFVAIILVVTFPVSCCSLQKEGFQDTTVRKIKCPRGTKTYTTFSGDTMCCDGNVEGNKCDGKVRCTLSGNSSDKVPTCGKLRQDYLAKLQTKCPVNIGFTSYEDEDTGVKGCAAQTTAHRSQPQTPTTKFCRLYDDKLDNENYQDSCQNVEKKLQFNTVFMNTIRPNFCLDIDTAKPIKNNEYTLGMTPCTGSDGQVFKIDTKGHVINKKGGILFFSNNYILLLKDKNIINKILSESDKTLAPLYNYSKIIKVPTQNGGFKITNTIGNKKIFYGLGTNNKFISHTTKNEEIVVMAWDDNVNKAAAAIEWNIVPTSYINKPN